MAGSPLRRIVTAAVMAAAAVIAGCAGYGERVSPVPLPETDPQHVAVGGAKVLAVAYPDADAAEAALGFDARGAGLLPVRFVVDNGSEGTVRLRPKQTFLVDDEGQAWPLLTSEQAYKRVRAHVKTGETLRGTGGSAVLGGAAGAAVGFAVGILTGDNVAQTMGKGTAVGAAAGGVAGGAERYQSLDKEIRQDLARHTLDVERVASGDLAYGYLFFPGKEEAESARSLRLGLEVAGEKRVVELPLR